MSFVNTTYLGACLSVKSLTSRFLYSEHLEDRLAEIPSEFMPNPKSDELVLLIPNIETESPVSFDVGDSDFVEITPLNIEVCIANFKLEFAHEIKQIEDIVGRTNIDVKFMCINYFQ
jgi:hypothetical protein